MRTKEKERADWVTTDWCPDEEGCYDEEGVPRLGGSTFCVNDVTARLIADVDDAVGLFERVLSGSADGLLLGEIRAFLKEPSDGETS